MPLCRQEIITRQELSCSQSRLQLVKFRVSKHLVGFNFMLFVVVFISESLPYNHIWFLWYTAFVLLLQSEHAVPIVPKAVIYLSHVHPSYSKGVFKLT